MIYRTATYKLCRRNSSYVLVDILCVCAFVWRVDAPSTKVRCLSLLCCCVTYSPWVCMQCVWALCVGASCDAHP